MVLDTAGERATLVLWGLNAGTGTYEPLFNVFLDGSYRQAGNATGPRSVDTATTTNARQLSAARAAPAQSSVTFAPTTHAELWQYAALRLEVLDGGPARLRIFR